MRTLTTLLAASLAALAGLCLAPTASAQVTARVVASCGSPTYVAGTNNYQTVDTTGKLCGSTTGGGGGAVTVADGADVTLGAKADAANCATAQTLIACIRQLHADMIAATPAGTNLIGYTNADPCAQGVKLSADFESATSGGSIITAASAKKAYVCSLSIVASAAANVSLIEGTGSSVCTGGVTAAVYLNTGVTAANGAAFAANGGVRDGGANAAIAFNATANQNICVLFTTTNSPQVNVHVTYVQQ